MGLLVALIKTVPEADNAKPAYGRTWATIRQNRRPKLQKTLLATIDVVKQVEVSVNVRAIVATQSAQWEILSVIISTTATSPTSATPITKKLSSVTFAKTTMLAQSTILLSMTRYVSKRNPWAFMERTSALQETIASPNVRKTILQNRGMLA